MSETMWRLAIPALLSLSFNCSACLAYKPALPKRHNVASPNLNFIVDVDPDSSIQKVYSANDRTTPLWTIPRRVWADSVLISNDGLVAAVINQPFLSADELGDTCIEFWDNSGKFKSYRYSELCSDPAGTGWFHRGPVGDHWRVWWENMTQDGNTITLTTTDLFEYVFSLKDGTVISARLLWPNLYLKWWSLLGSSVFVLGTLAFWIWRRRQKRLMIATKH